MRVRVRVCVCVCVRARLRTRTPTHSPTAITATSPTNNSRPERAPYSNDANCVNEMPDPASDHHVHPDARRKNPAPQRRTDGSLSWPGPSEVRWDTLPPSTSSWFTPAYLYVGAMSVDQCVTDPVGWCEGYVEIVLCTKTGFHCCEPNPLHCTCSLEFTLRKYLRKYLPECTIFFNLFSALSAGPAVSYRCGYLIIIRLHVNLFHI